MKWYASHVVMYFALTDDGAGLAGQPLEDEREFVVWENIVLYVGRSIEEVRDKAIQRGKDEEALGGDDLTWNDRPVKMVFGGVRKIVECDSSAGERGLSDGDEATYTEMKIKGRRRLEKMISGERVDVLLES